RSGRTPLYPGKHSRQSGVVCRCQATESGPGLGRVKTLERKARVEPSSPASECLGDRWQVRFELDRLSGIPFPSVNTLFEFSPRVMFRQATIPVQAWFCADMASQPADSSSETSRSSWR